MQGDSGGSTGRKQRPRCGRQTRYFMDGGIDYAGILLTNIIFILTVFRLTFFPFITVSNSLVLIGPFIVNPFAVINLLISNLDSLLGFEQNTSSSTIGNSEIFEISTSVEAGLLALDIVNY